MVPHKKPENPEQVAFDVAQEKRRLAYHFNKRGIPNKEKDKLLIATWNLTNFGAQDRMAEHLEIMAYIIGQFDVIAVQEIADDLSQFNELMEFLNKRGNYKASFSDIAGNQERLAFVYNASKVKQVGLVAELAMRGYEQRRITIEVGKEKVEEEFEGFNRNPYMMTFQANDFEFTLVNVHLYWSDTRVRQLETKALSRWAKNRSVKGKRFLPSEDIMLLGDFNMPAIKEGDRFYDEIKDNGLVAPLHDTEYIGSNLAGDKSYDQLFFFPKHTEEDFTHGKIGVYDFDNVVFRDLWKSDQSAKKEYFFQYIRYYIADHRPLWAQFDI
ncbi:endonuclease/exonuclease/phosphatase family protein [Gilvimarinus agarilyticus]|uniref:endonuclease/exonuclease/phosphatase family protein n=1 Tax=Reichenbachiella agariperforans TaxID=156994 RepID=UPI001C0890AE|nr:endonuclease/exonuclease/phosphatase family protein [Reichenbachiella agariperforans]MBU2887895.1 endonuclease/exonuclease/phosphatase family protein [Gilvimarinus agarilyticus]MBU2912741.1 endonuclease/exonuclease/phosphatase family protein [Reichenbachiella agariperforans]